MNFLDDSLEDFDDESGISDAGYDVLKDYYPEVWEDVRDFGKISTGILDLYMLAFKLRFSSTTHFLFFSISNQHYP